MTELSSDFNEHLPSILYDFMDRFTISCRDFQIVYAAWIICHFDWTFHLVYSCNLVNRYTQAVHYCD